MGSVCHSIRWIIDPSPGKPGLVSYRAACILEFESLKDKRISTVWRYHVNWRKKDSSVCQDEKKKTRGITEWKMYTQPKRNVFLSQKILVARATAMLSPYHVPLLHSHIQQWDWVPKRKFYLLPPGTFSATLWTPERYTVRSLPRSRATQDARSFKIWIVAVGITVRI